MSKLVSLHRFGIGTLCRLFGERLFGHHGVSLVWDMLVVFLVGKFFCVFKGVTWKFRFSLLTWFYQRIVIPCHIRPWYIMGIGILNERCYSSWFLDIMAGTQLEEHCFTCGTMENEWKRYSWQMWQSLRIALPKTNIAPEHRPSEKERIVAEAPIFRGFCC